MTVIRPGRLRVAPESARVHSPTELSTKDPNRMSQAQITLNQKDI